MIRRILSTQKILFYYIYWLLPTGGGGGGGASLHGQDFKGSIYQFGKDLFCPGLSPKTKNVSYNNLGNKCLLKHP